MFEDLEITLTAAEPTAGENVTIRYNNETQFGAFRLSAVEDAIIGLNVALDLGQPPDDALWQNAGSTLFDELWGGALIRLYAQATAPGRQTRFRFMSHVPDLLRIPWEYLYDRQQERPLALHPDRSLVRSLAVPGRKPVPVDGLLRVLVMISDPNDLPRLDSAAEWANLTNATATAAVDLIPIEPTYEALQRALRQHQPHIFHFVGHGRFIDTAQQGVLYFQQADGKAVRCSAEQLALLLTSCESLRLALLNACHGAPPGQRSAFAGVAQKLIQQGVPAVIAMQAPILDNDALAFSKEFYRALADGEPMEAALREGRKRIAELSTAWGVPTLYFQGSDLFAIPVLDNSQKAERLWQRVEKIRHVSEQNNLLLRLVAQILQLQPTHAGAQRLQEDFDDAIEAVRLYPVAEAYYHNQQWREAYRTLELIRRLQPNFRDTWQLLVESKQKLDNSQTVLPLDYEKQVQEYRPLLNALKEGRLVPFLGWDASRLGRLTTDSWTPGESSPSAEEMAALLAEPLEPQVTSTTPLLQVAQYTLLLEGQSALYRRLAEFYTQPGPPTILHHLLAELPGRLYRKGFLRDADQRFVIFTTALDDLLERAFADVGQPYHLFAYRHRFVEEGVDHPARFIHIPPIGPPAEVIDPLTFDAHTTDEHPIIIKLCGLRPTDEPGSVLITEDQFLDYLPAQEIGALLPTRLLRQINRRSFAFFGYSLQPWHLRLIWQRVRFQKRRLHDKSWAIVATLSPIEREFWLSQDITPLVAAPEGVVAYVNAWLETL
ncbi:MAG: CHAT domain-containing protein [Caldilineaceae bacterium]